MGGTVTSDTLPLLEDRKSALLDVMTHRSTYLAGMGIDRQLKLVVASCL